VVATSLVRAATRMGRVRKTGRPGRTLKEREALEVQKKERKDNIGKHSKKKVSDGLAGRECGDGGRGNAIHKNLRNRTAAGKASDRPAGGMLHPANHSIIPRKSPGGAPQSRGFGPGGTPWGTLENRQVTYVHSLINTWFGWVFVVECIGGEEGGEA